MPGPDYWQKPRRTSRDGIDYGNTRLGEPDPHRGTIRLTLAMAATLFLVALALHALDPSADTSAISPADAHSPAAVVSGAGRDSAP